MKAYEAGTITIFTLIAFSQLDSELEILHCSDQLSPTEGSTATAALLLKDQLHLAYIGDSSAILIRNGGKSVINLSDCKDSAENNAAEVERIEKAGGVVLKVGGTMRVQGELAVTRAFGDHKYKSLITSKPHVVNMKLSEDCDNEFLILATDGLWNALSYEEVATLVTSMKEKPENSIAECLYQKAVEKDSRDNITIAVINLEKRRQLIEEGPFIPPAAPTSRYASQNKKAFSFS